MRLFQRSYAHRGASPGAVVPSPRAVAPRITVLAYDAGRLEERTCGSIAEAVGMIDSGLVTWIDVSGLGDGTVVQEAGAALGLHPLAVSDVVNVGQRPKVDRYDDYLFVVLRMMSLATSGRLQWEQVSLFFHGRVVLTFQETHEDCLEPLRNRIRAGRVQIRSSGADYLTCMVVDAIVDGYFPILEHHGDRLEELETRILEARRKGELGELYLAKRDLAGFRRAAWPLRDALTHLLREEGDLLSDSARLHLRDALDHTMQAVELNESYRELGASLIDVHLSMVGQRTNDVMRVLTVVSAIFIPLTFVAGIYGMNFDTSQPLNLPELGWRLGYPFFWLVCLSIGMGLVLLFRRLGWLAR